jgi:hypothetical protein
MTTERTERAETPTPAAPASGTANAGPRGIGTAVAFDWGLTAQFLSTAPFLALGTGPGDSLASSSSVVRLLATGVLLLLAVALFALGEAVRRGRRLAWMAQVGINAIIFLAGFGTISTAVRSLSKGHVGDLVPTLIMLIASPIAVWLLTRKQTRQWIATTTSEQASSRHGGFWPWAIALIALIGGLAVTFAGSY